MVASARDEKKSLQNTTRTLSTYRDCGIQYHLVLDVLHAKQRP
jgi:hypothetical protein